MATTGELRAIIQELELVDIGDAASYLGEEALIEENALNAAFSPLPSLHTSDHTPGCSCISCQLLAV